MTQFLVSDQGVLVGLHTQNHTSLCTVVTICATLIVPKCLLSILTVLTLKSRSNPRQLLHPCQVHPRCKFGNRKSVAWCPKSRSGWPSFWCPRIIHQYVHVCKISGLCVQRLQFLAPFKGTLHSKLTLWLFSWPKSIYFLENFHNKNDHDWCRRYLDI